MAALTILELSFQIDYVSGISAWRILAKAPKIENLEELVLRGSAMNVHDLTGFILKHVDTLTLLEISSLGLHEATASDISLFYARLSNASKLEDFWQHDVVLMNNNRVEYIGLPRRLCLPGLHDGELEDGYIAIGVKDNSLHWKGHQEVKDVLADLALCLSW